MLLIIIYYTPGLLFLVNNATIFFYYGFILLVFVALKIVIYTASRKSTPPPKHISITTASLINTRDAQASLGYSDKCLYCDGCRRPLSYAIRSNEDINWLAISIPWCYPSMIYEVFLCDHYHPLFLVVWSSAAYHDYRHGQTMIACDAWRLTVKASDVRRGYWPVARSGPICFTVLSKTKVVSTGV